MFLVMLRHEMDDIPVKLFKTRKAATKFAEKMQGMPWDELRTVFKVDCSTPLHVSVTEFDGFGDPVAHDNVKDF